MTVESEQAKDLALVLYFVGVGPFHVNELPEKSSAASARDGGAVLRQKQ